jgi:glycosyltransferase involved in cell wall biosynthesis
MIDTAGQTPHYDFGLCDALTRAGCRVGLFASPLDPGVEPPAGLFPLYPVFGRWIQTPLARRSRLARRLLRTLEYPLDWRRVLRELRARPVDVVHVQWAMLPLLDVPALAALKRAGSRLVFTVHDVQPRDWWRTHGISERSIWRLADRLIVHSQANLTVLADKDRGAGARSAVVPLGSPPEIHGAPPTRDEARARLGLPAESEIVLFFGGLKFYKGLDLLIDAFARVRLKRPRAFLLIASEPIEPFEPYARSISRLRLADAVRTRLAYIPDREVGAYFSAADLVVLPYRATSFSGVLMTAYAFGRPVVVSATGGLGETVLSEGTGQAVPPGDVGALAEAIEALLADDELRRRMGARAAELAATRYSWDAVAAQTLAVYREALGSPAATTDETSST